MKDLFNSQNLCICELTSAVDASSNALISTAIELLSDSVVMHLPDHFKHIKHADNALCWYQRMQTDARLLVIKKRESNLMIGYIFIYEDSDNNAYIGYLLGEDFWGQGFASEALVAFIDWAGKAAQWQQLFAGVEAENTSSVALIEKLGFTIVADKDDDSIGDIHSGSLFYQLSLSPLSS